MKHIKGLFLLLCLLLALTAVLAACDSREPAADTTAPQADAPTEAPTEVSTDSATEAPTETPTETLPDEETTPPAHETEEETTAFVPPVADPEEAAALELPLDGDHYVIGGENAAMDPMKQISFLKNYASSYEDKTFTVLGKVNEDENGNLVLSLGEDAGFVTYFDGIDQPVLGSYVSVTATWTRTVDMGDYVDFACFTMMASSCEVLGEAKGPNGGTLMYITASSLNVRSSPDSSVSDNKVGLLYSGDMVEVLETELGNGTWCKITFDCDAGYAYISMKYISTEKP